MDENLLNKICAIVEASFGHVIEKSIVEDWDGDTVTETNLVKWTVKYSQMLGGGRYKLAQ